MLSLTVRSNDDDEKELRVRPTEVVYAAVAKAFGITNSGDIEFIALGEEAMVESPEV